MSSIEVEYRLITGYGSFHTHFSVCCNAIIEDTVTVKCRTTIKVLFHYFNLCLNVQGSAVELVIKLII
jgi:predicted MarR family transcription regulator